MPSRVPEETFSYRFRRGLRTHRALIAAIVFAVGLLLCVLAIGFFTPLNTWGPFPAINSATYPSGGDNYNLVFVVVGPIVSIVGAYLVGAYAVARRRFEHLMLTKSKAEFLRNIPEIEDLLWDLTPADEVRYDQKRSDLRLRR
jgi:hypothetical protein